MFIKNSSGNLRRLLCVSNGNFNFHGVLLPHFQKDKFTKSALIMEKKMKNYQVESLRLNRQSNEKLIWEKQYM